jgi:hypothetical protein
MQLKSAHFGEAKVVLDSSVTPRVLLAYPAAAIPTDAFVSGVAMGDREFTPMQLAKDVLDTELEGGGEILKAKRP